MGESEELFKAQLMVLQEVDKRRGCNSDNLKGLRYKLLREAEIAIEASPEVSALKDMYRSYTDQCTVMYDAIFEVGMVFRRRLIGDLFILERVGVSSVYLRPVRGDRCRRVWVEEWKAHKIVAELELITDLSTLHAATRTKIERLIVELRTRDWK